MESETFQNVTAEVQYPAVWVQPPQDVGGTLTWKPWEQGKVAVVTAGEAPVTAKLGDQVIDMEADGKTLSLENVADGSYTLELAQTGCVTRRVEVVVDSSAQQPVFIPPVQMVEVGNLNGSTDGSKATDVEDMQCLFEFLAQNEMTGALADDAEYFQAVADVNSDGITNILDYQALYKIVV